MLADSHTHILDDRLFDRSEEIVESLEKDGLCFVVEVSAEPKEAEDALDFAMKHKNVYCTMGVHPVYADKYNAEYERWVCACVERDRKGSGKIVAIGEAGLDYYHRDCPVEVQKQVFISQIKLSHRLGLPLVVHTRDAFEDTFEILYRHREFLANGLLIHCFSYGVGEVSQFNRLGAYFAFGGAVTYKNGISDDAIRAVPIDRLLVETDCPYLSPVPFRGGVNEPKNVRIIAQHIARVRGVDLDEIEKITLQNTKRFFGIRS